MSPNVAPLGLNIGFQRLGNTCRLPVGDCEQIEADIVALDMINYLLI